MGGVVVNDEAVPDTTAAVMTAPGNWAGFAKNLLEGFDDEVTDCAFAVFGR